MSSSKRSAISELNHDNWNDEDEGEEVGEFKKATEDELQKRVRKVAKRRTIGDSENNPIANPFSGFGGFNTKGITTSTPAVNSSPFGFLAKIPSAVAPPKTNGIGTDKSSSSSSTNVYSTKVKELNKAFVDWLQTHIDENPDCILTPALADYEKYLKEFEVLKQKKPEQSPTKAPEPKPVVPATAFSFGKPSAPTSSPPAATASVFTSFKFGSDAAKHAAPISSPPKPTFAGLTAASSTPAAPGSGLFSMSSTSKPLFGGLSGASTFSFGNTVQAPKTDAPTETGDDADEEPPKNEFVPVVEDDSLYSKRCKVFIKSGEDYKDRGIGMLYIKKVEDKIQMVVRADTNLGNVLFNIMIVDGLPTSRMGKNNVMVVCIPTPDAKPPPVSCLLRVKTAEDADDLLATINKYKQ